MIELIFAIVILSFVMMSIPMLMMEVKQTSKIESKQESIAMIATQMNLIMTQQWDDIQTRGGNDSFIVTTDGVTSLSQNGTFRGIRNKFQGSRVFSTPNILASTELKIETDGKPPGEFMDDIDDYNGYDARMVIQDGLENENADYIDKEIHIRTGVKYISYGDSFSGTSLNPSFNGATVKTSNIKEIYSVLTTTNISKLTEGNTITLRAFSSNIGGYDPETRGGI
jgi:type II secretory pathway pseudopilin PulG